MPKRKPLEKNFVRRQSSRRICTPKKFDATPAKRECNYWSLVQKQSLLNALTQFSQQYQLTSLTPKHFQSLKRSVKTKSVEQIRTYIEKLTRSIQKEKVDDQDPGIPLQQWVELCEDLAAATGLDCTSNMSKMLTTAARENLGNPSVGPDYKRLYRFMDALFQGKNLPELSPTDSLVILDCLEDIESSIDSVDTTEQRDFMIRKSEKLKEFLYSNKNFVVTTEMCGEIANDDGQEDSRPQKKKKLSQPRDQAIASCSGTDAKNQITLSMSSINPFGVPTAMLNFKTDDPAEL